MIVKTKEELKGVQIVVLLEDLIDTIKVNSVDKYFREVFRHDPAGALEDFICYYNAIPVYCLEKGEKIHRVRPKRMQKIERWEEIE